MRVTEARGKESVFNGASRGRRYGGRRIERRPTAHLAFARGDDDLRRASLKKKVISPITIEGHFLLVRCVDQNTNNSFDEDVSSSSSCLPCKFWNEPPLDFFMAPICRRRRRFRRWFYCAWFCGASSSSTRLGTIYEMEGALFQKQKMCMV